MTTREGFGDRARQARERTGLSQEAAAARIGVHPMTLSKVERGEQASLKSGPLSAMAELYGVSERWLATGRTSAADRSAERQRLESSPAPVSGGLSDYSRGALDTARRLGAAVQGLHESAARWQAELNAVLDGIAASVGQATASGLHESLEERAARLGAEVGSDEGRDADAVLRERAAARERQRRGA